ncbi:hypothetical protein EON66_10210 [archaeon]|nr:MAG: hypothetical protein EON66_10210 [archaeon]
MTDAYVSLWGIVFFFLHCAVLFLPSPVRGWCSKDRTTFVIVDGEPLFYRQRDGAFFPTLRLLHKCTYCLSACLLASARRVRGCLPITRLLACERVQTRS